MAAFRGAGWSVRHYETLRALSAAPDVDVHRAMFARVGATQLDRALAAIDAQSGSLVLCGGRGRGKTQFACWLGLRDAILHGGDSRYSQRYVVWRRACADEKRFFAGHGVSRMDELERADFLVLDEVQEELEREYGRGALTDLIDRRYGEMLRTVVIAATTPDRLQDLLGTSALTRLNETGLTVHCEWEPYR